MSNNQKFIAGLLLGAAAGAALVLYLNGEKGKELLSDLKEGAGKAEDGLKATFNEFDEAINNLFEKGKLLLADLEQKETAE
jgi:gas vesicle protein